MFLLSSPDRKSGFSLLEILIALTLIGILIVATVTRGHNSRQKLKNSVDSMRRTMRFASNESALRNTLVRLRFDFSKEPTEYTVEYGPQEAYLPTTEEETKLSSKQQEWQKKHQEEFNRKFTDVPQFEKIHKNFDSKIRVLGVATSSSSQLIREGEASIYFYPNGEKDSALILLASDEEIAALSTAILQDKLKNTFFPLNTNPMTELEDLYEELSKSIHSQWMEGKL